MARIIAPQVPKPMMPSKVPSIVQQGPLFQSTPIDKSPYPSHPRVPWGGVPTIRLSHATVIPNLGQGQQFSVSGTGSRPYPKFRIPADTRRLNEVFNPVVIQKIPNLSVSQGHGNDPYEMEQLRKAAGIPLPPSRAGPINDRGPTRSPNNPFRNGSWPQPQPQGTNPPPYSSGPRLSMPLRPSHFNLPNAARPIQPPRVITNEVRVLMVHLDPLGHLSRNLLETIILDQVEQAMVILVGMEVDLVEIRDLEVDLVGIRDRVVTQAVKVVAPVGSRKEEVGAMEIQIRL
ncbi:hypothetical protein DFH07DRAFT_765022 [Mycena maculata]|uniref:Uncharacterized protein n=1 Tax=Mycena maculata TaxID=230809 RepID=A0AAD7KBD3_9AGAR|nr:hypothetical protein DFH07DRAFT_765022 [Mycena maculata]